MNLFPLMPTQKICVFQPLEAVQESLSRYIMKSGLFVLPLVGACYRGGVSIPVKILHLFTVTQEQHFRRMISNLLWWPTRRVDLDAAKFYLKDILRFVKEMYSVKPMLLHGYVGAVTHIANYLIENQIEVHPPKAIWVTSAPLTKVQAKQIEKGFPRACLRPIRLL